MRTKPAHERFSARKIPGLRMVIPPVSPESGKFAQSLGQRNLWEEARKTARKMATLRSRSEAISLASAERKLAEFIGRNRTFVLRRTPFRQSHLIFSSNGKRIIIYCVSARDKETKIEELDSFIHFLYKGLDAANIKY